jgi:hypothetical protein
MEVPAFVIRTLGPSRRIIGDKRSCWISLTQAPLIDPIVDRRQASVHAAADRCTRGGADGDRLSLRRRALLPERYT